MRFAASQRVARYLLHGIIVALGALSLQTSAFSQAGPEVASLEPGTSGTVMGIETVLAEVSPTPVQLPRPARYVVQDGDTVSAIARRFGVSVDTVVWANGLENPDRLYIGQELQVPPVDGVIHVVGPGDTVRTIADRYGASPAEVIRFNSLNVEIDDPLPEGVLVVPGGRPPSPAPQGEPAKPDATDDGAAHASDGVQWAALDELHAVGPTDTGRQERDRAVVVIKSTQSVEGDPGQANTAGDPSRPAPLPTPSPSPTPRPKPSTVIYEVQPGDTISALALKFGVSAETLLVRNSLTDPDQISIGQKLKVLPVSGIEHQVREGETLADIARLYRVDLGPIIDFNGLLDPDLIQAGQTLIVPGARLPLPAPPPAPASAAPKSAVSASPAVAQVRPPSVPAPVVGAGGDGIAQTAMRFNGYPYSWGGSSPAGFDCSGLVWYVHKLNGRNISRGLWGQLNGGPRVDRTRLQPGDTVFFANTYMPGLSHNGIYLGGDRFIHAADERSGVRVSVLSDPYWASRYVGATRLW